jgi:hypothetical protein
MGNDGGNGDAINEATEVVFVCVCRKNHSIFYSHFQKMFSTSIRLSSSHRVLNEMSVVAPLQMSNGLGARKNRISLRLLNECQRFPFSKRIEHRQLGTSSLSSLESIDVKIVHLNNSFANGAAIPSLQHRRLGGRNVAKTAIASSSISRIYNRRYSSTSTTTPVSTTATNNEKHASGDPSSSSHDEHDDHFHRFPRYQGHILTLGNQKMC